MQQKGTPRWLHYWAIFTVCATMPLLLLGAHVTTLGKEVAEVDAEGFRTPWHLFEVKLQELGLGFLVEHSHRLVGWIVGFCTIVLFAGLWWKEPRRSVKWLGTAALLGVGIQGLLGGFRVQLMKALGFELAFIHGLFAQIVFALLTCIMVVTSRAWQRPDQEVLDSEGKKTIRRGSLLLAVLVFGQILLGAFARRTELWWAPRIHLLFAFVVIAMLVWTIHLLLTRVGRISAWAKTMALLTILQVFLGMEAWLTKFYVPRETYQLQPITGAPRMEEISKLDVSFVGMLQAFVKHPDTFRSFHFLVGSWIFASAVALCLITHRQYKASQLSQPDRQDPALEGAA